MKLLHLFPSFLKFEADFSACRLELARAMGEISDLKRERDSAVEISGRYSDEVTRLEQKAAHWEEKYEEANAQAIQARELVADWLSQRQFGIRIFGKNPELPAEQLQKFQPIMRTKRQARDWVNEANAKFEEDLAAYQKQNMDKLKQQTMQ